jgi:uncharacterized protein YjaZ
MKTTWINTNNYYHQLIATPPAERTALYYQLFIEPWKPMMDLIGPMFNADPSDPLAVARAWAWILPEDLDETPAALPLLEAADAWTVGAGALAEGAARFAPYAERLSLNHVSGWLVIADPARSDPIGRGYTGAIDFTQPRLVVQVDTPNDYTLSRLPGAVVHELHHLIRLGLFPWDMANTSVADYIVHEGLAESYAVALFGKAVLGYYVTDFDEHELGTAKALIGEGLMRTGFDVIRGYIFGDTLAARMGFQALGMPDYGGYAIGYRVVQAYLDRSGHSIEEATFLPAAEIVQESGFFA